MFSERVHGCIVPAQLNRPTRSTPRALDRLTSGIQVELDLHGLDRALAAAHSPNPVSSQDADALAIRIAGVTGRGSPSRGAKRPNSFPARSASATSPRSASDLRVAAANRYAREMAAPAQDLAPIPTHGILRDPSQSTTQKLVLDRTSDGAETPSQAPACNATLDAKQKATQDVALDGEHRGSRTAPRAFAGGQALFATGTEARMLRSINRPNIPQPTIQKLIAVHVPHRIVGTSILGPGWRSPKDQPKPNSRGDRVGRREESSASAPRGAVSLPTGDRNANVDAPLHPCSGDSGRRGADDSDPRIPSFAKGRTIDSVEGHAGRAVTSVPKRNRPKPKQPPRKPDPVRWIASELAARQERRATRPPLRLAYRWERDRSERTVARATEPLARRFAPPLAGLFGGGALPRSLVARSLLRYRTLVAGRIGAAAIAQGNIPSQRCSLTALRPVQRALQRLLAPPDRPPADASGWWVGGPPVPGRRGVGGDDLRRRPGPSWRAQGGPRPPISNRTVPRWHTGPPGRGDPGVGWDDPPPRGGGRSGPVGDGPPGRARGPLAIGMGCRGEGPRPPDRGPPARGPTVRGPTGPLAAVRGSPDRAPPRGVCVERCIRRGGGKERDWGT